MMCFLCDMFVIVWLGGGKFTLFFGGGELREGKSSFADVAFGAGLAVCKCAFSFVVALIVCFKNVFCRIYFHIVKVEVYIVPI